MAEIDESSLDFRGIGSVRRGCVLELLAASYRGWAQRAAHLSRWREEDRTFFDHPDTVGACAVFTFLGDELVGLVSWDPRPFPTVVIAHNCVVPARRGRGIGKRQLLHALDRLRGRGFGEAVVTTGASAFFLPARRMYLACGFQPDPAGAVGDGQAAFRIDLQAKEP